ncbi:hypothetical protein HGB25_02640 [Candidatus Saccharibacteria bacterium]|nr:hypothetical protein [Candidatus Saccharibacteria bacterium]
MTEESPELEPQASTMRTVQWNINGGMRRDTESDPWKIASFDVPDLEYFINVLRKIDADVVTLQEVHVGDVDQARLIADALGMSYLVVDDYNESHLAEGERLAQAILSRYPIKDHEFVMFENPGVEVTYGGVTAPIHDKGLTRVNVELPSGEVGICTTALIPFKIAGVDPLGESELDIRIRDDVNRKLASTASRLIIQGDFNVDLPSLEQFVPTLFQDGTHEVVQDAYTTPREKRYDHVFFKGVELAESVTQEGGLADHYPIVSDFKITG